MAEKIDWDALKACVRDSYTPTRPILLQDLFSGRIDQIKQILEAIREPGRHPIIFGDRGIGKTSLANVVVEIAKLDGMVTAQFQCSSGSTAATIFRSLLGSLTYIKENVPAGFETEPVKEARNLAQYLPQKIGPTEIVAAIRNLRSVRLLLVIDEFDRVSNGTNLALSDVIKHVSDLGLRTTFLLVGVGDSLAGLVKNHPSVERNTAQVALPLMSPQEIVGIVEIGEKKCGVRFASDTKKLVADFAQGVPYYAHLLSLHAAIFALNDESVDVTNDQLKMSIERSHNDVDRTIRLAYNDAVSSSRETTFPEVLYAAAKAQPDEFGCFSPTDMTYVRAQKDGGFLSVNALQYPLSQLTSEGRGRILTRVGQPRRYKYRFTNPMMRQYVLLRQAAQRGDI